MPHRTWTDEQLIEAVAHHSTLRDVKRALGLRSGSNDLIRRHISRLGIDASHIRAISGSATRRPRTWADDDLPSIVSSSTSYADVMRRLGYEPSGGIHRWLKKLIRDQGISTEHFLGQAWSRGLAIPRGRVRPIEEYLVVGSLISSGSLRRRLIKEGLLSPLTVNRAASRSGWVSRFP